MSITYIVERSTNAAITLFTPENITCGTNCTFLVNVVGTMVLCNDSNCTGTSNDFRINP
jgi:hypothetical protein